MTRYATLSRKAAVGLLALLAVLIALGLALPSGLTSPHGKGSLDLALYRGVVEHVRAGEPYERAAMTAQRAQNYPVKPFVAVRPPALAIALAWLPSEKIGDRLLMGLALAVIVAWTLRLMAIRPGPLSLGLAALTAFTGAAPAIAAGASLFHETWAGLLIALSLAVRSEKRFAAAVILGLLAALIRELALPYLMVMALFALGEGRRREAWAFAAALILAFAALALHAHAVLALTSSSDPASQGWVKFGGWRFVLASADWNLLVQWAGTWMAAVLVPLALLGAGAWKDRRGLRLLAILAGYTLGFMIIGRPENTYWGLVIAPLLAVGLYFAPWALRDLARRTAGVESF